MNREELKDIIARVIQELENEDVPQPACIFSDMGGCDVTTLYAVGEEG